LDATSIRIDNQYEGQFAKLTKDAIVSSSYRAAIELARFVRFGNGIAAE
jgi:hypothetical protein